VKDAIDAGYRHLDCAYCYQNEKEVGAALAEKFADGTVKREDLFITSKLWNTFHSADSVQVGLKKTLADLGVDYLDLYLIHWPVSFEEGGDIFPKDEKDQYKCIVVDHAETWKAMEKCVELGLVRSIGLSNFNSEQVQGVLNGCSIKPVMNQVECHPFLNQAKLKDFCAERGVLLTAYSPLGSPGTEGSTLGLLQNPEIQALATKYGKSTAQILIRYQIERGVVVIPKSVHKNRILENFDVFDFQMSAEDVAAIDGLNTNLRFLDWLKGCPGYSFGIEF